MDLWDRVIWLAIGCFIGFVLGYIVRSLRDIKDKVDHMDEMVTEGDSSKWEKKGEDGAFSQAFVTYICLALVVFLTAWAAFISQQASNEVKRTQEQLTHVTSCNRTYLTQALEVLNGRTVYTRAQAEANINLQTSFNTFLQVLAHKPPYSLAKRTQAFKSYATDLQHFVAISRKNTRQQTANPIPKPGNLTRCFNNRGEHK